MKNYHKWRYIPVVGKILFAGGKIMDADYKEAQFSWVGAFTVQHCPQNGRKIHITF